jgi:hypothetical protein
LLDAVFCVRWGGAALISRQVEGEDFLRVTLTRATADCKFIVCMSGSLAYQFWHKGPTWYDPLALRGAQQLFVHILLHAFNKQEPQIPMQVGRTLGQRTVEQHKVSPLRKPCSLKGDIASLAALFLLMCFPCPRQQQRSRGG